MLSSVIRLYKNTAKILANHPVVLFPFTIFAVLESLSLLLLFLAPRMPFSIVFGPLIRTLWTDRFLHYPLNFLLLPKLASLAKMGLSIIVGSLLTGMAVALIADAYHKKPLRIGSCFRRAAASYVPLFFIILLLTTLFYLLNKVMAISLTHYFFAGHRHLLFIPASFWMGPLQLVGNLAIAIVLQSFFIYAIPAVIIERVKLFKALRISSHFCLRSLIPTLLFVGIPLALTLPLTILNMNSTLLITRFFPESVLLLLYAGIIVNSLIIDALITTSATLWYLDNTNER